MKKLIAFCFALFAAFALYAQKSLNVAIYENVAVAQQADNDVRTGKLLQEYLKSELATHSGIDVKQSDKINDKLFFDNGFRRGQVPAAAQIVNVCKILNIDYLCLCSVVRTEKGLQAVVDIYSDKGVKKGNRIVKKFDNIRLADKTALLLGKDIAIAIRGPNPIDDVMLEKYNRSYEDIEGKQTELDRVRVLLDDMRNKKAAEEKEKQKKASEQKPAAKPAAPAPASKAPQTKKDAPKDSKK